eukprot:TRINITY_DN16181_c0_g1_i2.p1 TRINITY_DN16181_c0_g1~~TRINITY_DN16181_c0_g1_i2.p1  ORF type:complete len:475 (+),score=42.04 TRINITY_DN16181_c0_g1_i2:82-1425(+)
MMYSILALSVLRFLCMIPSLQCEAKFLAASRAHAFDARSSLEQIRGVSLKAGAISRHDFVRRNVAATLSALPRNSKDKFDVATARHAMRSFFAREHGWQISGLSSIGVASTNQAGALSEKAPNVVRILEKTDGLSEEELVSAIVALEEVVAGEISQLLFAAYGAMGWTGADVLSWTEVLRLLSQYLDSIRRESTEPFHDFSEESQSTAKDAILNFEYAERHTLNPFAHKRYSFYMVADIATRLTHAYGQVQNADCLEIKEHMTSFDTRGIGRVSLDVFHRAKPGSKFVFSESADYLEHIGALDSTTNSIPQVRIANYILGPGNCIARSSLYSICCLNECESIMREIESEVRAPWASPDLLLSVVSNLSALMSSSSRIPANLVTKLSDVANLHDGRVNLHGRSCVVYIVQSQVDDGLSDYDAGGWCAHTSTKVQERSAICVQGRALAV